MKTKKVRKVTFRQRLRADADERLTKMIVAMRGAGVVVCDDSKTNINPYDVMRLACGRQNKSLRYQVVSDLANEMEAELEKLYNKQMNLLKEDSDGE